MNDLWYWITIYGAVVIFMIIFLRGSKNDDSDQGD